MIGVIFLVLTVTTLSGYVSAQIGLCPQPSGDFPNPSSEQCTTFFRCVRGQPNLLRCPANQRFDFLFRICRPQDQVDCNNQLQIYAAPNDGNGQPGTGQAGLGAVGVGGLGTAGGLGNALGGGLWGGVGAGLPQSGLINFLLSRQGGGGDGGGGTGSQLALIAALGQMMNQRRAAARVAVQSQQQRPPQQQTPPGFNQQAPPGFNQQIIPLYNPGGLYVPPPPTQQRNLNNVGRPVVRPLIGGGDNILNGPTIRRAGFGANPNQPIPGIASLTGLLGQQNNGGARGAADQGIPLKQFINPVQLQNLVDLATTAQEQTQRPPVGDNNDDDGSSDGSQ